MSAKQKQILDELLALDPADAEMIFELYLQKRRKKLEEFERLLEEAAISHEQGVNYVASNQQELQDHLDKISS
jgi:hypothetical protein